MRTFLIFIFLFGFLGLQAQNPFVGQIKTYSVQQEPGVTYTWTVPADWTIQSGQGTDSLTVLVGNMNGYITVTPSNACGDGPLQERYLEPIDTNSTAIDPAIASSYSVYPNPVVDLLTVSFTSSAKPFQCTIFDMKGSQLFVPTETSDDKIIADFSVLPAGVYTLKIKTQGQTIVHKIIHP